jgi:hypothetical protein
LDAAIDALHAKLEVIREDGWRKFEATGKAQMEASANGALCCVIDVGSRKVYPGGRASMVRTKDVEAMCQNIAALWPIV